MAINKTFWASYKGRESIVERFVKNDKIFVREIWPLWEPREHASPWDSCGLVELDREVWLTTYDEYNRLRAISMKCGNEEKSDPPKGNNLPSNIWNDMNRPPGKEGV